MADNFFPSRGCVYRVDLGAGTGKCLYELKGLANGTGTTSFILLTGVELSVRDLVLPVSTTKNFQVLYVFGQDFGNIQVNGEILLGSDNSTTKVDELIKWFEDNRVGKKTEPSSFSIGNKAFNVYINGLVLGNPDTALNVQPFALVGIQVGLPK